MPDTANAKPSNARGAPEWPARPTSQHTIASWDCGGLSWRRRSGQEAALKLGSRNRMIQYASPSLPRPVARRHERRQEPLSRVCLKTAKALGLTLPSALLAHAAGLSNRDVGSCGASV